jgi:cytoskeletal protein RodZ
MLLSTAQTHGQADPAEALMREVGEQLRQVRLERGQELAQVAEHLRIKPAYLHALEQGDMAALPGRTYALGFLRTYADYLGFNGNELIARIRNVVGTLTDRSRLQVRTPMPESRMPKTPVMLLSLAFVLGVYGVWVYMHSDDGTVVEAVGDVPQELRETALDDVPPESVEEPVEAAVPPEPAAAAASELPEAEGGLGEPPAAAPAAQEPLLARGQPSSSQGANGTAAVSAAAGVMAAAPGGAMQGDQETSPMPDIADAEPGPVAALAPPEASEADAAGVASETVPSTAEVLASLDGRFAGAGAGAPRVHGAADTEARVILRASSTSWIEVSSADGDYTEAATLLPGEVFLVPDRPGLTLWLGNAGGLEVIVDGERLPPLGEEGVVMRRVPLDRASLLARGEAASDLAQ